MNIPIVTLIHHLANLLKPQVCLRAMDWWMAQQETYLDMETRSADLGAVETRTVEEWMGHPTLPRRARA